MLPGGVEAIPQPSLTDEERSLLDKFLLSPCSVYVSKLDQVPLPEVPDEISQDLSLNKTTILVKQFRVLTFRFLCIQSMMMKEINASIGDQTVIQLMESGYRWIEALWRSFGRQKLDVHRKSKQYSVVQDINGGVDLDTIVRHQLGYMHWGDVYENFLAHLIFEWMRSETKYKEIWFENMVNYFSQSHIRKVTFEKKNRSRNHASKSILTYLRTNQAFGRTKQMEKIWKIDVKKKTKFEMLTFFLQYIERRN